MEAEESESNRSSDGNNILDLSYSSSSFEGNIGGEDSDTTDNDSVVVEPYSYEPRNAVIHYHLCPTTLAITKE